MTADERKIVYEALQTIYAGYPELRERVRDIAMRLADLGVVLVLIENRDNCDT